MTYRCVVLLVLLTLLSAACASGHSNGSAPPARTEPVWTSPAEPSPPGDTGR